MLSFVTHIRISKLRGYTLIELMVVMALSIIIISMISLALYLIQKQIEANKETNIYDYCVFNEVLDNHLFFCEQIRIDNQTIQFSYPDLVHTLEFKEEYVILDSTDSLMISGQIVNVENNINNQLIERIDINLELGNKSIIVYKTPNYNNAFLLNHKFIDFGY